MALPREVVSLSQLLRRNEKSSARPRIGTAPPLPLQTSRRRVQPQPSRLPPSFTECVRDANRVQPQSSRLPPSFTESVRDANRVQPDGSQPGVALELSQKAYEAESEQLSALTSISQSSFSQTQSQNLLGSSQETKLRQAQLWEALPSAPKSPVRCNGSEILQDLNQNFTKAIAEQIREQKQQQRQLMLQFASPMKKSVEQIRTDLVTCKKDHQSQVKAIGELAKTINKVTSAVSELQKQSKSEKEVCAETRTIVSDGTAAVQTALTSLQARVETVECSVKSCSGLLRQVREEIGSKHQQVLSAVAASSCTCHVEGLSVTEKPSQKRKRTSHEPKFYAGSPTCFTSSLTSRPVARGRAPSTLNCESAWRDEVESERHYGNLQVALQHIQCLRDSRRTYLQDW